MNDSSKVKTAAIRARLKFPSRQAFIQGYAQNISKTGIFVKTAKPKAEGVRIKFEFQIADGTPVLRGIGEVSWNRETADAGKPPGMGIKFLKLDTSSREVIDEILAFKGEGEPIAEEAGSDDPASVEPAPAEEPAAEEPAVAESAPVEAAFVPGEPTEPAPVEAAVVEEGPAPVDEQQAESQVEEAAPAAPTQPRTKTARRRRSAKSTRKKDAGGIDFGAIDSMLAEISADSDTSSKRASSRRARREAQKEREVETLIKEVSEAIEQAPVTEPDPGMDGALLAETAVSEPMSDSGIEAVDGDEPTFEPSLKIKLDEVLELSTEAEVEIDSDSGVTPDEATEPVSAIDGEDDGLFESVLQDEDDDEEEETDRYDLADAEIEPGDEEVELIPLADDDERQADQSVDVIPIEDDEGELLEETDIEELIDDESDGGGVSLPPADAREQSVGDFMDEMKSDDEELPPPATETLLQNAEVEEALDDIFQMAGDSEQSESTGDSAPEPASGEAAEASTDDQAPESDATEETEPKKKKGFFKKLFG